MSKIVHPEYLDELRYTNYPFEDDATLVNDQGVFIPQNLIEDMVIYMNDPQPPVYLSKMVVEQNKLEIWFGDQQDPYQVVGTVDYQQPPDEVVLLRDGFHAGMMLGRSEVWSLMRGWSGEILFTPDQTALVAKVVLPLIQIGVRTISNGEQVHSGDVWLIGGDGVQLTYEQVEEGGQTYHGVAINVVGDPLFKQAACYPDAYVAKDFIKEIEFTDGINSVVCNPDEFGNILITVVDYETPNTIARIEPQKGGLKFSAAGDQIVNG